MSEYDPSKPKLALNLPPPNSIDWTKLSEELAAERIQNAIEKEWQSKHGWKDPNVGTCRVCNGKVFGHVTHEYDSSTGPMIIGPETRFGGPTRDMSAVNATLSIESAPAL